MGEEYRFIMTDQGVKVYYREALPAEPKAIVIVCHGYGEHSGFYVHVMDFLASHGYGVYALDHRGHGRSEEERGHLEKFEYFLEDLDAFVEKINARYGPLPLFMFGHSMGGLIAFAYGILHPEKLWGQVFTGPAVGMPTGTGWIPSWIFKLIKKYLNRYKVYPVLSKRATRNMDLRKKSGGDPLVLRYATAGFFYEFIYRGIRFAQENAVNYRLPCLFLHGTADRIIPYSSSSKIFARISSQDKELKLYEGLYHELVQEPERDEVIGDILAWFDKHI